MWRESVGWEGTPGFVVGVLVDGGGKALVGEVED